MDGHSQDLVRSAGDVIHASAELRNRATALMEEVDDLLADTRADTEQLDVVSRVR